MDLIPYVETNGQRSIPDNVMIKLWEQIVEEGIHKLVFYEGTVQDANDFLSLIKNKHNILHTVWKDKKPLAILWINDFGLSHAFAHFLMFKAAWGKHTIDIANMSIKYWFNFNKEGKPLLDVIIGQTPANNSNALNFIEKIGMKLLGVIPNISYDIYTKQKIGLMISYITREEF